MARNKQTQPSNEEQMQRRQSAPKPSLQEEAIKMVNQMKERASSPFITPINTQMQPSDAQTQSDGTPSVLDGFQALASPIGKEAVQEATQILMKYKQGKANLETRVISDEQWYKLRHWGEMKGEKSEVQPASAWLFNCIANKHADAMDNFPSANILPREEADQQEAKMLTSILPVILDQNDFEEVYSDVAEDKLKSGTGIYGVFWDANKLNGLGDISIKKADIVDVFWEAGITDIQESRNFFHVKLVDNKVLQGTYPQLLGKLSSPTIDVAKYVYDDSVDTSDKSVVVDWYYKKLNSKGKQILHYCKYVNDEVLYATENDQQLKDRGFYDHAQYPFVFDTLFSAKGTPTGFGYIDVGKSAQEYIDRGNQAIMKNMLTNAKPRWFIRSDGAVNETEYADMEKDFIHVDGNLGQDSILQAKGTPLSDIYVSVINNKVDELKETTGNRDVSTGGSTSGVTAASAIAAMQEAGSKLSRDSNKAAYRKFRQLCLLVIELIRQFYDKPRCFRIMGERGSLEYVNYSNANIKPQDQGIEFGVDMGVRIPLFDIEVSVQKQSPYSRMSQNELALEFYDKGFFNPANSDQALACLSLMDFDRKDIVIQKISDNSQLMQQLFALAKIVDAQMGTNEVEMGLAQQFGMPMAQGQASDQPLSQGAIGGQQGVGESRYTRDARQRATEATSPK